MGYYVQGALKGKANFIRDTYNGRIVSQDEARNLVDSHGVIAVKGNGLFDAAGFCFNAEEFANFTEPNDPRPTEFVVIDRDTAKRISGYDDK